VKLVVNKREIFYISIKLYDTDDDDDYDDNEVNLGC
jgi:hypothetical protein